MKKIVRDELDIARHEFGSLVKDGFTLKDDFMVDLLEDIENKKAQKAAEKETARVKAPAPPYIKDVIWQGDQKTPRIGGKGLLHREFAMFAGEEGEATYRMVMNSIKWKKSPCEPWRVVAIHIMAWELAEAKQEFPKPEWLDLQAYGPRRFRTMREEAVDNLEEERIIIPESPKSKKKRPTKKDMLDAKYAELMRQLS